MMITSVRIRNFKSFVDETVILGPLSIIVGGNGVGKSNLFDALRFLRSIGEGRSVRDAVEGHALPGAASPSVSGIRGGGASATHFLSDSTSFSIQVGVVRGSEVIDYYVEVDAKHHRVVQEELKSSNHPGPYVFSTRPESGPLEQLDDSPVVTARFHKKQKGLNPKRDFSAAEFVISQFVSRRAESRANEIVGEAIRDELTSILPLELQPEMLRKYSPVGRFEMGEHGENFAAAVWKLNDDADAAIGYERDESGRATFIFDTDANARRDAVVGWLSQVTPRPISELKTVSAPTGEVVVSVVEEPFPEPVTAPSLSDGTLRFAALGLAALGQPGRRTLVIEELENGINPSRLALLIAMFEQTVATDDQVQVIASTHSPSVLDYFGQGTLDSSTVIGWDADRSTSKVVLISDLPGLEQALRGHSIGELQEEGWLQFAAAM